MAVKITTIDCNIFGDFKVGDNTKYNADILSNLVMANNASQFNKLIVLQTASILEAAFAQIFYRATYYNREGLPNVSEANRVEISEKQIDKLAIIIDNLEKYRILDGVNENVYHDLHTLRKYRNKIHIQTDVKIPGEPRDEEELFTDQIVRWALCLNWRVLEYLEAHYARPEHIRGHVQPLRLPRAR